MLEIIVCLVAGLGAGIGTGFAGISAAAIISPMLITFLGIPAYTAIGVALASDVLASAVSAWQYGKNKNIDIKNGISMLVTVLVFTMVGSYVSQFVSSNTMGGFSIVMTVFMGLRFLFKPVNNTREINANKSAKRRFIESVACGMYIGFICGFIGAGGGLMMLFVLTSVLGYELKTAVGTSVFVMAFTAFTGAASHMIIGGLPDPGILTLCIIFTLAGAMGASKLANKLSTKQLNFITGMVLSGLGILMLVVTMVKKISGIV